MTVANVKITVHAAKQSRPNDLDQGEGHTVPIECLCPIIVSFTQSSEFSPTQERTLEKLDLFLFYFIFLKIRSKMSY